MTQQQLDRAVAQATGESLATVRRHGFSLFTPLSTFDPDVEQLAQPQMVDWDEIESERCARAA
jgi:hypothetical protein